MSLSWIGFIVSGLLAALAIWIAQRTRLNAFVRLLCVALILGVLGIGLYLQQAPGTLGGPTPWYEWDSVRDAEFFLLMLLGVACRYVTRAIEIRRDKIAALEKAGGVLKKPPLEFDLWEFSYPLFISVITFGVLLSQINTHEITIANSVLSFQTGFFWQTLLAAKQKENG